MYVNVSASIPVDQNELIKIVPDASVSIMYDDIKMPLGYQGNGIYSSQFIPISGNKYSLDVIVPDKFNLRSNTIIPHKPQIELFPYKDQNLIQITIKDSKAEKNSYWIGQKVINKRSGSVYYETYIYSDFLYFDDFNRTSGGEILEGIRNSYHFYARLDDYLFSGKEVSILMPRKWPQDNNDIDYKMILYIINADEHLDQYMKSALIQYDLGVIGDMPVFHTPVDMYSNIENGKGIFGSYTISQFDITTPESIYQNNETGNTK